MSLFLRLHILSNATGRESFFCCDLPIHLLYSCYMIVKTHFSCLYSLPFPGSSFLSFCLFPHSFLHTLLWSFCFMSSYFHSPWKILLIIYPAMKTQTSKKKKMLLSPQGLQFCNFIAFESVYPKFKKTVWLKPNSLFPSYKLRSYPPPVWFLCLY